MNKKQGSPKRPQRARVDGPRAGYRHDAMVTATGPLTELLIELAG